MSVKISSCHKDQPDILLGEKSQPLVSVIIPVFNTEKQLPQCIESVLGQQMRSIEIVLIDDGSTDGSGVICDTYAEKDERVKVFHTSYQGVASARNLALQKASCDYIMFVDSDDWVSEDFCSEAYRCAVENNADVVMFGFQRIKKIFFIGVKVRPVGTNVPRGYKTKEEAIDLLFHEAGNYCWNKLCRKSLFQGSSFPEGRLYEDVGTVYKVVWNAEKVYYLPKPLYHYCSRPGSISTVRSDQACRDWAEMYLQMLQALAARGHSPEKLDLYQIWCTLSYCIRFGTGRADVNIPLFMERFRKCIKVPAELTWKRKILYVLLKHYKPLFDFVCIMWGTR